MFTYADVVSIEPLESRAEIPCKLMDVAVASNDALISSMWAEDLKAVAYAIGQAEGQKPRGLRTIARILGRQTPYTVPPELRNQVESILTKRAEDEGIFSGA
jgi:hypothetical protein